MENPFDQIHSKLVSLEQALEEIQSLLSNKTLAKDRKEYLSVTEAAEFLNITPPTIYSKVSRKELPYMKRNGRLYFSMAELTNYLESGKVINADIRKHSDEIVLPHKKSK
ncbi:helix-turn-helix domain-containing protein [bacterium]|nr:helix-turn-helix domain-containing protein [bacterium]